MITNPFVSPGDSFSLPPGKTFLVWLSHDVDRIHKTFFHAVYYTLKQRKIHHLRTFLSGENPYWSFRRIMEIEDRYNVKSTFFFLNETMSANIFHPYSFVLAKGRYKITDPSVQEIICELDRKGWEIGVHGSYLSFKNQTLLRQEKEMLEKIVGHPILGTRQHHLNLKIPQTWEIHRSLGFRYDASFGSNEQIGYRDQMYYPFHPFQDQFTVFPLTVMDAVLFSKDKDINIIWKKCLSLIDVAQEKKGFFSLLWHQQVFNDLDFPGYTEIYERCIQECRKRNAQFCTGKDVDQYIMRYN